MERRKGERYVVPEIYRKYITFKVKQGASDYADGALFDFSPNGIGIVSRYELPEESEIECLISVPKSLTQEIPFTAKIKYCIQDNPGEDYLIGAEIIQTRDKVWFALFSKVHDFIKERIGEIY
ncbi:MAG: hypothetical protein A2V86_01180 [Deltaproteobacteria bacterium RBG_16_49_23]|nr:MAG: hypothetical protein A2V86_01180 [Deltaproteobacteria bacterium RBG_16_49_23]